MDNNRMDRRTFLKNTGRAIVLGTVGGALTACGTAVEPEAEEGFRFVKPDGSYEELSASGIILPIPKWLYGGVTVEGPGPVTAREGSVTSEGSGIYRVGIRGSENATLAAEAGPIPIISQASPTRIDVDGGEFIGPTYIGVSPQERGPSPSALEDLIAQSIHPDRFAGAPIIYGVLTRTEGEDAYNNLVHTGGIEAAPQVYQALDILKQATASDRIDEVHVGVTNFGDSRGESLRPNIQVYSPNRDGLLQIIVGNGTDSNELVAQRASGIAYDLAPIAAAEAYLTND